MQARWQQSEDGDDESGEWQGDDDGQSRNRISMDPDLDYLYGVSPVLNALASQRRKFKELYVQEVRRPARQADRQAAHSRVVWGWMGRSGLCYQGLKLKEKKDKEGVAKIFELAERLGVPRTTADKHQLNLLSDNR